MYRFIHSLVVFFYRSSSKIIFIGRHTKMGVACASSEGINGSGRF